jgi:ribonuclease HI
MELTAAIKALEAVKASEISIDLYTDSKYVIQGINDWIDGSRLWHLALLEYWFQINLDK